MTGAGRSAESCEVGVVIVNYRTAKLVADCLASLWHERVRGERVRVVVVDNASGDGSAEGLRRVVAERGWGEWARVVSAERNGGFAFGNNVGTRALREWAASEKWLADLIWYLNPDTVVRSGAVKQLEGFLRERDGVGIVGSRLVDAEGAEQLAAHRFPSLAGELANGARLGVLDRWLKVRDAECVKEPRACDWVSGASLMARAEVIERIGGWDEGYFLYFEEVALCQQAKQAGWDVWYEPRATVVHLEGSATGIGDQKARRARYWFDSRRRYLRRRYGVVGLVAADILWLCGRSSLELRTCFGSRTSGRRPRSLPRRFVSDLMLGDLWAVWGRDWWTERRHVE